MAHRKVNLSNTAFSVVGDGGDTVTVQLPHQYLRSGRADRVELVLVATGTTPAVPADRLPVTPLDASTVLENSRYQAGTLANLTIPLGETLWGRWLSDYAGTPNADKYVIVF